VEAALALFFTVVIDLVFIEKFIFIPNSTNNENALVISGFMGFIGFFCFDIGLGTRQIQKN